MFCVKAYTEGGPVLCALLRGGWPLSDVSTWRRACGSLIYILIGYKYIGSEGEYEQFTKDNKKYRLHKFKQDALIELDS